MQHWNDNNENLIKEWGEKTSVLRILHSQAARKYKHYAICFKIPVIIMSTVAGSVQLRQDTFCSKDSESLSVELFLGVVNLLIAILTGLGALLRFEEQSESHRSSSNSFGNFYRQVSCELSYPREEREPPTDLLKSMKRNYDSLIEASPTLPSDVIEKFKKQKNLVDISLPDICNGLDPIRICKNNTFSDDTL